MVDAHLGVLGSGLGGTFAACEVRLTLKGRARVTAVEKGESEPHYEKLALPGLSVDTLSGKKETVQ